VPGPFLSLLDRGTAGNLEAYQGDHTKELKNYYERRDDYLYAYYENKILVTKAYWKDHAAALLQQIWDANPTYKDPDVDVFYTVYTSANAASYGQGLITLNLGLVQHTGSEDELAFVLCHEIAHQYLSHVSRRLHTMIDKMSYKGRAGFT